MPKRSPSQHVPKDMQARFDEITQLTDAFCHTYLNDEYKQLCCELTATLCRKRPSPLVRGKATTWACGIIHALGMVNFLFRPIGLPGKPCWAARPAALSCPTTSPGSPTTASIRNSSPAR